ncbi:MAG: phosphoserine phosphatase SerB [Alphaproteobacteria bacterium]|nr:MAG: phosphoserine phosphatase SerB [Alphaproteobacteria bacterium]
MFSSMPGTVVTIVAGQDGALNDAALRRAVEMVRNVCGGCSGTDILDAGKAADITVETVNPAMTAELRRQFFCFASFDIFVQSKDEFRKKRLLVADMDATMIEGETLDELAAHFGLKDQIAPITAKAMRGEIDFAEALRMRVGLLKGMPVSALYETLKAVRFSKGAATLVGTMNRSGAKCVLISGGFDLFTSHVANTLGFYKNIGNRLGIHGDKLTGEVLPPIVDKFTKKKTVEDEARLFGIEPAAVVAIGDGANDIPMLQTAGAGVGYFGKPAVQEATPFQIRHTDLTSVLYMQGYRREEFAA